jgi:hypothetical protein
MPTGAEAAEIDRLFGHSKIIANLLFAGGAPCVRGGFRAVARIADFQGLALQCPEQQSGGLSA